MPRIAIALNCGLWLLIIGLLLLWSIAGGMVPGS